MLSAEILGLVAGVAGACPGSEQIGLVEMLRRVESLVSELRGLLDERGVCKKVPEACESLGESLEEVKRAEDAADALLLELANLLLGLWRGGAGEAVERLSRLQGLAGAVYVRIERLIEVLGVLREFLSAYGRLVGGLDTAVAQALVEGVLRGVRDALCGYISSVVEGLEELRGYYEARGRLVVYHVFELVFGYLALLLSSVLGKLEEFSEQA